MVAKTVRHDLKHPVEADGKAFASITLREPDIEALEAIDDLAIEPGVRIKVRQLRSMIEILGDLPPEVVGKIHRDDFAKITVLVVPLLDAPEEEVSSTSSPSGASTATPS